MCVIIASPGVKYRPTLETLKSCEKANPHGSGIAWIHDGRVHYLKGLTATSIADSLPSLSGPVVIHFRIASVGGVKADLCHPFPIESEPAAKRYGCAKAVLFHNGTWSDWQEFVEEFGLELDGPVSDTRVAAAAAHQFGFQWLKRIPSRFAMLSKHGIKILGEWHQMDGVWFSNNYWCRKHEADVVTLF